MSVHIIKRIQRIPVSLAGAWGYFSSPANLQAITPEKMACRIISAGHGDKIYPGQIIEYKIKPLFGIEMYWMTEITQVEDQRFFIDEQRIGPYRMWHHQHHFKAIDRGVEMTDIVHYKNPFGIIGRFANGLFVKKRLQEIFDYRFKKVEEIFGSWADNSTDNPVV